jgi:hypothetical protein
VACPNAGRLVARTLSPLTATVVPLAMAGAATTADAISAAAPGTIRRKIRQAGTDVDSLPIKGSPFGK